MQGLIRFGSKMVDFWLATVSFRVRLSKKVFATHVVSKREGPRDMLPLGRSRSMPQGSYEATAGSNQREPQKGEDTWQWILKNS